MRAVVSHSDDPSAEHAVEDLIEASEAQLQGVRPKAGLLYVSAEVDRDTTARALMDHWPDLELIGCTTDGELSSAGQFQEGSATLMLFAGDGLDVRAGLGRNLTEGADAAVEAAIAGASIEGRTPGLVVALPESLTVGGFQIVEALNRRLPTEVPVVGGAAADNYELKATHQIFGGEVLQDAIPILAFYGDFRVSVGISSGWNTIGEPVTITRSEGNVVYEIEGKPAIEFYQQGWGANILATPEYPLHVVTDDGQHRVVAPLFGQPEEGSVVFASDVPQGSKAQVSMANHDEILAASKASVDIAMKGLGGEQPDAVLVFSCAARKNVLGTKTYREFELIDEVIPANTPVVGFYTYGEIAPIENQTRPHFHNETFITVLVKAA